MKLRNHDPIVFSPLKAEHTAKETRRSCQIYLNRPSNDWQGHGTVVIASVLGGPFEVWNCPKMEISRHHDWWTSLEERLHDSVEIFYSSFNIGKSLIERCQFGEQASMRGSFYTKPCVASRAIRYHLVPYSFWLLKSRQHRSELCTSRHFYTVCMWKYQGIQSTRVWLSPNSIIRSRWCSTEVAMPLPKGSFICDTWLYVTVKEREVNCVVNFSSNQTPGVKVVAMILKFHYCPSHCGTLEH